VEKVRRPSFDESAAGLIPTKVAADVVLAERNPRGINFGCDSAPHWRS
jgi:hypothetical protein